MFRAVALVPSPPLLVPELTGGGAAEASDVRAASLEAARFLAAAADLWVAVGVGDRRSRIAPTLSGTFAGYGVDVAVALSPRASASDPELPLAALIAGWLRGQTAPGIVVDVRLVEQTAEETECRRLGRELREEMDSDGRVWGLLVIGDGATTLTEKAPGSFDSRAAHVQAQIDDALATADLETLATLDRRLCHDVGARSVAAWQTLAGVVGTDRLDTRTLYRGAPFGVGYFVGTWDVLR
ncbi:class III extradiol dioxygenase subunit B-like domain-containing protein [Rhodococcus sovatensis]|uniref:Class III extradiol dioxygenase subunit B-like domain-containing protein n=1 Tax=Rhodococcus sovatensis TaxID=1805840 RepID=A0ABZ2PUP5_9NOCA